MREREDAVDDVFRRLFELYLTFILDQLIRRPLNHQRQLLAIGFGAQVKCVVAKEPARVPIGQPLLDGVDWLISMLIFDWTL